MNVFNFQRKGIARLTPQPKMMFGTRHCRLVRPGTSDLQSVTYNLQPRKSSQNVTILGDSTAKNYRIGLPPQPVTGWCLGLSESNLSFNLCASALKPDCIVTVKTWFHVGLCACQTAALPIPGMKSGEEKGYENGTGASPFLASRAARQKMLGLCS